MHFNVVSVGVLLLLAKLCFTQNDNNDAQETKESRSIPEKIADDRREMITPTVLTLRKIAEINTETDANKNVTQEVNPLRILMNKYKKNNISDDNASNRKTRSAHHGKCKGGCGGGGGGGGGGHTIGYIPIQVIPQRPNYGCDRCSGGGRHRGGYGGGRHGGGRHGGGYGGGGHGGGYGGGQYPGGNYQGGGYPQINYAQASAASYNG